MDRHVASSTSLEMESAGHSEECENQGPFLCYKARSAAHHVLSQTIIYALPGRTNQTRTRADMPTEQGQDAGIVLLRTRRWHRTATNQEPDNDRADTPAIHRPTDRPSAECSTYYHDPMLAPYCHPNRPTSAALPAATRPTSAAPPAAEPTPCCFTAANRLLAALPAATIQNGSSARKENNVAFLTGRTTTKPEGRLY